jgi:hypothetical protein
MKKQKRSAPKHGVRAFDIIFGCAAAVLIIGGIWYSIGNSKANQDCGVPGREHQVTVQNDTFQPAQLDVSLCDTIKISNLGTQEYDFAFGTHDKHVSYPGFTNMQSLQPNQYFEIDAIKTGDYTLHDHLRDQAHLRITINP